MIKKGIFFSPIIVLFYGIQNMLLIYYISTSSSENKPQ